MSRQGRRPEAGDDARVDHEGEHELPLLDPSPFVELIGNTTEKSIHSGVIYGICKEIDGVISEYESRFEHLTVILTGGDGQFLSNRLKNTISYAVLSDSEASETITIIAFGIPSIGGSSLHPVSILKSPTTFVECAKAGVAIPTAKKIMEKIIIDFGVILKKN